jgi:uncharacterized peroxidase-related enzyme
MIIETPAPDTAAGHAGEVFAHALAEFGVVPTHVRVMEIDPGVHDAFEQLVRSIVPSIGVRLYELVTLAAARALQSGHCLLAHGHKTLAAGIMDEPQLRRLAHDYRDADLTEAEIAAMGYAEMLSTDAAAMTDADSQALRDHGYSDQQILGITLAAAARNFFSRSMLALAVPLEELPVLDAGTAAALLEPARR